MSGDTGMHEQPLKFYSDHMSEAKRIIIEKTYSYQNQTVLIRNYPMRVIEMVALKQAISENPASDILIKWSIIQNWW
ncbi:MAG: hypothetical protein CM15mV10_2310 [uncultured marine virus]|nr:MAG: hypothetical protein CM15mV10_2310 [uncultured marine virus]